MRADLLDAVFSEGRSVDDIGKLMASSNSKDSDPVLFTRLSEDVFDGILFEERSSFYYDRIARTACNKLWPSRDPELSVAVISAGLCDAFVAQEASITLKFLGFSNKVYSDCGVDDFSKFNLVPRILDNYKVVIVVAGLDAALATLVGSVSEKPVICVPTSVGYGVSRHGESALASMLLSCAPGLAVVNIDNGYGAACMAARILNLLDGRKED
ncbi:MAG: nickel pincer cofactor biosynthesis protein LarB [Deltaproteobacteria bacterium]|jgi:NCAIR mutase (PurE)-related protein|nr:nickel pincer cofactor biosynthesis protein LarB [Deltaproteobacteria bacterium]